MLMHHDSQSDRFLGGVTRELWEYRELFFFLAWRDVKVRYKQTALGVVWAVLQPLLTMAIFTVLFGRVAGLPSDGVPKPVFYLAALVPWAYISGTVNTTAMSLVSNTNLLTKIYFPRMILPASAVLSGLLDFCIGSIMLFGVIIYYGIAPGPALLLWPVLVILLALLTLAIGMLLAALNVRYRDVKYAVPFAIQLWLFVTPIIYPSTMVPEQFRWLLALNPLTGLIEAFRHAVVPASPVSWELVGVSVIFTFVLLAVAITYFRRTEKAFADIA